MNALLLLVVMREGGMFYVVQTATGFVLLGFFTDLFAPFVAPLAHADLMLPAMWGGIITASVMAWCCAPAQHRRLGHDWPNHLA